MISAINEMVSVVRTVIEREVIGQRTPGWQKCVMPFPLSDFDDEGCTITVEGGYIDIHIKVRERDPNYPINRSRK